MTVAVANNQNATKPTLPGTESLWKSIRRIPFPVLILVLTIMTPYDLGFNVGSLFMTSYRVVLIAMFLPCVLGIIAGKAGKICLTDWLMLIYAIWPCFAFAYNEDIGTAVQSGGVHALEVLGGYLIARRYITDYGKFRGLVALLTCVIIGLIVFTAPESISGVHIIRNVARALWGGGSWPANTVRWGLIRACGPFQHPIIYGAFCASMLGTSWYSLAKRDAWYPARIWRAFQVCFSAFFALSSGTLLALACQTFCVGWEECTRWLRGRWYFVGAALLLSYAMLDAFSDRGAVKLFIESFSMNSASGYNRYIIWTWGSWNMTQNPFMGLGFNDWIRPDWDNNKSMDCIWLVEGTRFGFPAFLAMAGSFWAAFVGLFRLKNPSELIRRYRNGWIFSMCGLMISGISVDFWNAIFVYFFFILGSGMWMLQPERVILAPLYKEAALRRGAMQNRLAGSQPTGAHN